MAVAFNSCKKTGFETKPQLVFEGINGDVFASGQLIELKMRIVDKEGDVSKSSFTIEKVSLVNSNCSFKRDFAMPTLVERPNLDAELNITYGYNIPVNVSGYPELTACTPSTVTVKDSAYFRLWVKDNAGNVSDTIETPRFVLLKP